MVRRIGTFVAVALLVVTSACGPSGADDANELSVGFIAEPANLDFTSTEGAAIPEAMLGNVYEGLVRLDQRGKITPALAKSWTISPDRRTYTFTLRKGVRFTHGVPFTAEDVVFSLNRVKTEWKLKIASKMDVVESVTSADESTVVVRLTRPSNSWLYTMTTRLGAMFSRTGVSDLANKPIGTGPYRLGQWRRGDSIVLRANEDYWGPQPKMKTVTLKYFKDGTALNNALLTGAIDVISGVQAPESLAQFEDTSRFRIHRGSTNSEVVLAMNNQRAPFDDIRVRQAVRHAINHQDLLKTAWAGQGELIGSMVPPTDPWYEDRTGDYPYDPDQARRLLAQTGDPNPTVNLRIANLPYAVAAAQVVKSQLAAVGITVEIEPLEFPARWLSEVFTEADYDMSIVNHIEPRDMSIFADPDYYFGYDNPEYRRLLDEADKGTEAQQIQYMKDAARLLSQDAAADWLFLLPNLTVADKDVTGLPKNDITESFELAGLAKNS